MSTSGAPGRLRTCDLSLRRRAALSHSIHYPFSSHAVARFRGFCFRSKSTPPPAKWKCCKELGAGSTLIGASDPSLDSRRQAEDTVDELIGDPHITLSQPSYLPFPNLVDRLVTLESSPRAIETTKMLLGTNPLLDGPVVLLQDVIQVRDRPMPTAPP